MSRRSSAVLEGPQKFSWRLESFEDASGRQRHKAVCLNFPNIMGIGDSEQEALVKGQVVLRDAAEKSELG